MEQRKSRDILPESDEIVLIQDNAADAAARAVLVAAARTLIVQNPDFSLRTLLRQTGIAREQFGRCFARKQDLLAAVTAQDVQSLDGLLAAAEPATPIPAPAPAPIVSEATAPVADAWLERRLRVFERALAGLEKRQEKFEQDCALKFALIAEQQQAAPPQPAEIQQAAPAAPSPMPAPTPSQILAPSILAHVEEIAATAPIAAPLPEKPVSEKEMSEFLHAARIAAQKAAIEESHQRKRPRPFSRWLAWSVAALMGVLVSVEFTSIALAMGEGAHAPRPIPAVTVKAQAPVSRVVLLADNGNAAAQTLVALDSLKAHNGQASRWALAAARQGQPLAQYLLGTLLLDSDPAQASSWFAASAAQGNLRAMHNLAIAYAEGLGLEKDPALAVTWFRRAAEQGYRDSQFDLAVMYERGSGVIQNQDAALRWYFIAAANGDAPSLERAQFLRQQIPAAQAATIEKDALSFKSTKPNLAANQPPAI